MNNTASSESSSPVNQRQPRMVVPDIARGLALLGIAVANAPTAWFLARPDAAASFFGGASSAVDNAIIWLTAIGAHNRGLPMFSTLLGFGVGLIAMSLWRRQFPVKDARKVIARRYAWLAVFGVIHGVFIFFGDIMMFYGICGVLLALMLSLSDKALRIIAWVLLGLGIVIGIVSTVGMALTPPEYLPDAEAMSAMRVMEANYGAQILAAAGAMGLQLVSTPMFLFMYFPVMLIGFVWARRGVLADVDAHRKTLTAWVVVAVVISLGIGIPWAWAETSGLESTSLALMTANTFIGVLTGPGILAGLALALNGVQKRVAAGGALPGALVPLAALGKRSMSGYVLQSILFGIIAYPFLLNLGHESGAAVMAGYAVLVWAITLVVAWLMELKHIQGPLEKIHRRLAYGPTSRPELKRPQPAQIAPEHNA